MESKPLIS